MNKLISVIVPVYNAEEYIGTCLDSVLAQTYTDFEIVVVNDCTPDGAMVGRFFPSDASSVRMFLHC